MRLRSAFLSAVLLGCPTITVGPATIPDGTARTAYSQTFTQTGGTGTITWSLTGTLPSGLTLNTSSGVLSGTPLQVGSFPITVTATDSVGCAGSRGYTLLVRCQVITVLPTVATLRGTINTFFSTFFIQQNGLGTITWSLTGALPAGLALDTATGQLSGTPTESGSFPITVTATDGNGCTGSRSYGLVIRGGPFVPIALVVDSAGNRVFEPGESVVVAPSWRNDTGAAEAVTGNAHDFNGPGFSILDANNDYGLVAPAATVSCASATGNCYTFSVAVPSQRPSVHWDGAFAESLSSLDAKNWTLHLGDSFSDVPRSSSFYRFVETVLHRSVTSGCGSTLYCPTAPTTREQMAVFVLLAKEGPTYLPPLCGTPVFADVPASSPFCPFIEELARRAVVSGCGGGNYCPQAPVTREQMAVYVVRMVEPDESPPPCGVPIFNDVPASSPYCRWIEDLAREGVVSGCGGGNYCPQAPVTREQMSVFIAQGFGLTLYGP